MAQSSNRPSSNKQAAASRDRRVGSRAQARKKAQQRTRIIVAVGVVGVVALALVIALVAGKSKSTSTEPTVPTDAAAVVAKATSVPAASLDAAGIGTADPSKIASASGAAITVDGKPEMLYVGAEYCPFCAAQRWAMVIALSRFGTFSNLGLSYSSSTDVHPDTPTFSFHGSSYSSKYLAFTAVETSTRTPDGKGGYTPLDTLTAEQNAIVTQLNPQGSIPFIDFGGKYSTSGAIDDPGLFASETHTYVLNGLSNPNSPIGRNVLGAANLVTAAICSMTGQQPASVCTSAGVTSAAKAIGG
jgi:hypothetical protein